MKNNPLVGAWKLKSLETRASDGSVSYPWGKETLGYAVISPEGYFCVAIMSANRRFFPSQDMKGGSVEERANAADSCISYAGPCEIEKGRFRVKVEVSLFPHWIGTTQERNYKIDVRIDRSGPGKWKGTERLFDLRTRLIALEIVYRGDRRAQLSDDDFNHINAYKKPPFWSL